MIRDAELSDIRRLMEIGRCFETEANLVERKVPIDYDTLFDALKFIINNGIFLVAENKDNIIGVVGGILSPQVFNRNHIVSTEVFWWVKEEFRGKVGLRLLGEFEKKSKINGATHILFSTIGLNEKAMNRLYTKRGYGLLETHYIKTV